MIPLNKNDILFIVQKRRDKIKVSCVFCDKRLGWFDVDTLKIMLSKDGISMCEHCEHQYRKWFNGRE